MKTNWLIPCAVALLVGAVAFGVTRRIACQAPRSLESRLCDISYLVQELDLNPAQAEQIKNLHAALSAQLTDCCAKNCSARAKLAEVFASETNGGPRTDAYLAEMGHAYETGERATLANIQGVRSVLNEEQRQRFDEMLNNCMCQSCSMPATAPGDAKP